MRSKSKFRLIKRAGIVLICILAVTAITSHQLYLSKTSQQTAEHGTVRDPQEWPFAWDSIWNLPIGLDAIYVPAGIQPATGWGVAVDEDILILEPNAPQENVVTHDAGWDRDRKRCDSVITPFQTLIQDAPIPKSFSTDPGYLGGTPNLAAAILMPDGVTIKQTQPFHRCGVGGVAISQYNSPDDNLKTGDGIQGAHGGSGMSSLGGTIRMGELVPGGVIRHALKLDLYAQNYLYYEDSDPTPGYRWPAVRTDSYAGELDHVCRYGGTVAELEMGALLALKPEFDIYNLQTKPAKILAHALKDYGGYVVDDSCWDVYLLATEWGPNGRVIEEFEQVWGFPFQTPETSTCTNSDENECKWAKDMAKIFSNLHVIANNHLANIGGAGKRRVPCAPPFKDGSGVAPVGSICW